MYRLIAGLSLALSIPLLYHGTAYAYVDPGTGGMFYQIIILLFGAIAAYFAIFRRYIKNLFSRKKATDEEDK